MDTTIIQRILKAAGLATAQSITEEVIGTTNSVYRINDQYILKIDKRGENYQNRLERNVVMSELCQRHGIPGPRIIAFDTSRTIIPEKYVVMTKLPGVNLHTVWDGLPTAQQREVAESCGQLLAQLHRVQSDHCGNIVPNTRRFDTWYDLITARNEYCLRYVTRHELLTTSILASVRACLDENDSLLRITVTPTLVHSDFRAKNIMFDRERVSGIFDFDECLYGHREFDFKKIFLPYTVDFAHRQDIITGYRRAGGSLSTAFERRVRLYCLHYLLDVLSFLHSTHLLTADLQSKYAKTVEWLLPQLT